MLLKRKAPKGFKPNAQIPWVSSMNERARYAQCERELYRTTTSYVFVTAKTTGDVQHRPRLPIFLRQWRPSPS